MSTEATAQAIHKTITVDCSVEHAFATFTERIGAWWPIKQYSVGEERTETAVIEPRQGGRVYEVMTGGEEASWGEVLVWEPPRRLVLAWQPNPESPGPTEVEVQFTADGEGTRVDLEHRGWEIYGDRIAEARGGYESGWPTVLGLFAQAASS